MITGAALAILLVVISILIFCSALFSGLETALFSLRRHQLRRLQAHHASLRDLIQSFRDNPNFVELDGPVLGAIAVYWRRSPDSGLGHVGFYMGETATKLRLIFDETAKRRGVYLFDEFDAVGGQRTATNDVAEMRRALAAATTDNFFRLFRRAVRPVAA